MRYNRLFAAASVGACLVASSAAVAASPPQASAPVQVSASLAPTCDFTTAPPGTVSIAPTAGVTNLGDLGYTCNFTGNAHLTLNLVNGTQLYNPSNGGDTVLYQLAWGIPPNDPNAAPPFQSWTSPQSIGFDWQTAPAPNVEIKGPLRINLPNALTVAGTYTSVISYDIAP